MPLQMPQVVAVAAIETCADGVARFGLLVGAILVLLCTRQEWSKLATATDLQQLFQAAEQQDTLIY